MLGALAQVVRSAANDLLANLHRDLDAAVFAGPPGSAGISPGLAVRRGRAHQEDGRRQDPGERLTAEGNGCRRGRA